jgi:hypothetical protein
MACRQIFNYKKFIHEKYNYFTKYGSAVDFSFKSSPSTQFIKMIIDRAKENDVCFFQDMCKSLIEYNNVIEHNIERVANKKK